MKKAFILLALFFISACTATPKINLVNSMGMNMELKKSAYYITSVAISSDGKYGLSAGGYDKTIRIWDLLEGKQKNLLIGHSGVVNDATLSPNGKYVISGAKDKDKSLRLWDSSTGKEVKHFVGHEGSIFSLGVTSVAFSPDGNKIAALSPVDGTIRLWDIKTDKEIMSIGPVECLLRKVIFSPDGKYILLCGWNCKGQKATNAILYDASSGKQARQFEYGRSGLIEPAWILDIDISHDSHYVMAGGATGLSQGIIKIWDISSGEEIRAFKAHSSLNGVYLYTAS